MQKNAPGIYDARTLGAGKMTLLGMQHMFAMFGATILVPLLTGLSISVTLLCAGVGTIIFHLLTRGKMPVFLGSSFAFLAAFGIVAPMLGENKDIPNVEMLPYALGGVVCAGLVYVVFSFAFRIFGAKKVMRLFPPVVTGPIIILIGLILAPVGLQMASTNWLLAVITIVILIAVSMFGKGMIKIVPIIIAIAGAYIVATIGTLFGLDWIDFSTLTVAKLTDVVNIPPFMLPKFEIGAIITFVVAALAAMIEHIGDVVAVGATTGKNYIADPGFARTLLGDGLATSFAGVFGGPANTTYSENTGVLALTKVYDPRVVRIAAFMAILLAFFPIFDRVIGTIPTAIIGGVSFVMYGMISAVGLRNVVDNHVDFSKFRNVLVAALILVCGLGFNVHPLTFTVGTTVMSFGGLSMAAIVGIVVNAILPGKDYEFNEGVAVKTAKRK